MKEIEEIVSDKIYKIEDVEPLILPLITPAISCGFPSPAEDYLEERLDILRLIVKHPETTYVWRAGGDSMIDRMIKNDTLIIFDKMVEPKPGDAVACRIHGGLTVKELFIDKNTGKKYLKACNADYEPIEIDEETGVEVLGKVTYSITKQY